MPRRWATVTTSTPIEMTPDPVFSSRINAALGLRLKPNSLDLAKIWRACAIGNAGLLQQFKRPYVLGHDFA